MTAKFYTKTAKVTKLDLKPEVYISWLAWEKVKWLLKEYDYEFCFLLEVEDVNNQVTIQDIHVIEQGGEAAFTHMVQTAVDSFALDAMQGKNGVSLESLKGWGHSHVNMGVFESGEDDDTSRNSFGSGAMGYCLSLVVNKKHNVHLAMHFHHPIQAKCECTLYINQPEVTGADVIFIDEAKVTGYYTMQKLATGGLILEPIVPELTEFKSKVKDLIKPLVRHAAVTKWDRDYGTGYTGYSSGKKGGRRNENWYQDDLYGTDDFFGAGWKGYGCKDTPKDFNKTIDSGVNVEVSDPRVKVERTKDPVFDETTNKGLVKKLREKFEKEDKK